MSKILAIDYGTKNIGLALSDSGRRLAFPYNTLSVQCQSVQCQDRVISDLKKICLLEDVERVVLGMPLNLSGEKTKMSEEVFGFSKKLEEELDVPVEVEDERLTTVQAQKLANKGSRNIDELSAQILLQSYLDKISTRL